MLDENDCIDRQRNGRSRKGNLITSSRRAKNIFLNVRKYIKAERYKFWVINLLNSDMQSR